MATPPHSTTTRLEVCQGPDCFGSGGGAALLEIEELVQEYYNNNSVSVVRGACRNFCTLGPNVHYNVSFGGQHHHFTRVVGVVECQNVLDKIANPENSDALELPVITKLLLRQSERQRWQALRLVARIQKSPIRASMQQIEAARGELHDALEKEKNAVETVSLLRERTKRRRDRLWKTFHAIVEENAQLSDTEEAEEEGSES